MIYPRINFFALESVNSVGGAWQKVHQFPHIPCLFLSLPHSILYYDLPVPSYSKFPYEEIYNRSEIQSNSVSSSSSVFILLIHISRPTNIDHDYSRLQLMYSQSDIKEKHNTWGQDSPSVLSIARTGASLQV